MFARKLIIIVAAASSLSAAQGQIAGAPEPAEAHRRAVEALRDGDHATALPILRQHYLANPGIATYLHDYVVALSWSGQDRAALELEPLLDLQQTPQYVIDAVAKSARNAREYDAAIRWYQRAVEVAPEQIEFAVGLALSLAEAGRFDEADAVFDALAPEHRASPQVLAAQAYRRQLGGDMLAALTTWDQLLEIDPNDAVALRGKAIALRDLLLPEQALELAREHPGILTEAEIERLEVDALAVRLRLAAQTQYPADLDGVLLDRTIEQIDARMPETAGSEAALALEYDRITALTERNEAQRAVEAFAALDVPLEEMPPYILTAAGRAYLQLEQPREAARILERANRLTPGETDVELALIYAWLDLDRYADAAALIKSTLARNPMLLEAPDASVVKGNEDRMRAEVVAAITDSSIAQHDEAQARLEGLLADSPNNADLRHELAGVYRWRGWLDRSVYEYDQVLTMDDSLLYAQVGRANALLDAQRFAEVEATLTSLDDRGSAAPIVERLSERWSVHNRSELIVNASTGESTGTTFGSRQRTVDAYWFSRPISYNYRAFVHLHDAFARYPEGDAQRQRAGVGTEYRDGPWSLRGELLFDRDYSSLGFAGSVDWRFSDRWQLSGQIAANSSDTDLRGYQAGVESDAVGLSASLSVNESIGYSFGVRFADFNDGNRAQSLFGNL
ncbi:MAG TPA: poly-beta-1,6 N-acetyl-D-glucosamine export porin PgaA, partial [Gammaproteobacteria bacterium]|nr:poly-beta-1,6 N-acetyl-D-glucosamine export porin PgaA [Gammaproteobacteria bacterium]